MTHQAHDVAVATITAVSGLAAGLGAVLALKLARGDRVGHAPAGPAAPGVVATGYRYCPQEFRTRAAVIHSDGSATCGDCGTRIPAMEAPRA